VSRAPRDACLNGWRHFAGLVGGAAQGAWVRVGSVAALAALRWLEGAALRGPPPLALTPRPSFLVTLGLALRVLLGWLPLAHAAVLR